MKSTPVHHLFLVFIALLLSACAATHAPPTPEARSALAPTGTLRGAVLLNTALQVTRSDASGELQGVSIDLGTALARRLGVSYTPVPYKSIDLLMDGAKTGQWDIAFMAIDRSREKDIDYAGPFMDVEMGYLVPASSSLKNITDVDRPGVRVVVSGTGGTDIMLSRLLKQAQLVRATGVSGLVEALKSGKADAAAANKPTLFADTVNLPGSRVLDGRVAAAQYAIVTRKGQDAGNAYVRSFIEEAKANGLIKSVIDKAGLRGVIVAAPQ
jgi:polar amino acid transport system substrate-binding protein